jgi:transketolase
MDKNRGGIYMHLDENEIFSLKVKCNKIRKHIIESCGTAGSGHPGGSLSCVELLTALYFKIMKIDSKNPGWEERDRFILSKGHACPALYGALAERGFFPVEDLKTLRKLGSKLQGHPDSNRTPGVDASAGSLGQGLSIANGMAMAGKLNHKDYYVYALLGDGEIEEGQVWEAAMSAAHYQSDHLIAFLDYNHYQIDGNIKDVMCPEPVAEKFKAFGWDVLEIAGHNIEQIISTIEKAKGKLNGKPTLIVMHTTKGKGVSFMENRFEWHGKTLNAEHVKMAMAELEGEQCRN